MTKKKTFKADWSGLENRITIEEAEIKKSDNTASDDSLEEICDSLEEICAWLNGYIQNKERR